ncbi:unnamed protein product [Lactuca saligna]|uniref:Uncharacterized protein n=1 Tax=Lactuca saligna TaxID=75948 RepID=A0AA36A0D0_LACSI|nr:unnamed protein product [Lactuca saligna]
MGMSHSRPAPPSQSTVVVVSPVRSPIFVPSSLPAGVQARRDGAPIRKRGSFLAVSGVLSKKEIVVVPSCPEASHSPFTGSPLVNLGFGSMFGGASSSPGGSSQCEKPSLIDKIGISSHSLSFEAYALGWAITRDSLLSEDTTAQE